MDRYRYVVVDVFTDMPLTGNQLAVFTDARGLSDGLMQRLAKEMNFAESVFVLPKEGDGHVRIRIFTPERELPFAGHPTLGAAFVLAAPLQLNELHLETGSGVVPVRMDREEAKVVFGRMEQPAPRIEPFAEADALLAALGVRSELPVELYDNGVPHVYVALATEAEVAALAPNFQALRRFEAGINCFAPAGGERWKTRMFAPALGVNEDAATGSAAGPLALHLVRHGRLAAGTEIAIAQGEEIGRPSTLYASAEEGGRIEVGGSAVVVARGEFKL